MIHALTEVTRVGVVRGQAALDRSDVDVDTEARHDNRIERKEVVADDLLALEEVGKDRSEL
jgi:hypothetical protein